MSQPFRKIIIVGVRSMVAYSVIQFSATTAKSSMVTAPSPVTSAPVNGSSRICDEAS